MTGQAIGVVQSHGKSTIEDFDREKLHGSIYAALLTARSREGEAHDTAAKVCDGVTLWLTTKSQVTSDDIRRVASKYLYRYHADAAYLYEHLRHTM